MPNSPPIKRGSEPFGQGLIDFPPDEAQPPKRFRPFGWEFGSPTPASPPQELPGSPGSGEMARLEEQIGSKRFQIDFDWRDPLRLGNGADRTHGSPPGLSLIHI